MAWYVLTCPDHGQVATADDTREADTLAGAHDVLAHRSTPTTRIEARP